MPMVQAMSGKLFIMMLAIVLTACSTLQNVQKTQAADNGQKQWTKACKDWDEWDKAGPAYRIYGNSYYVGSCGISAILIKGDQGDILIDSGTAAGAPIIIANIRALGFDPKDVKLLLHSHEHFDHVGGMAILKSLTGARLLASLAAAPVISSGKIAADDPQAGMHKPFAAAPVDGLVNSGEPVKLGRLILTPYATPGHTQGALSWHWKSCEGNDCRSIVYADSLSPISNDQYRFSDHAEFVSAVRNGLSLLSGLSCDIILTPHPSASKMVARLAGELPFVNTSGCSGYAAGIAKRLDNRLAKEGGPNVR